MRTSFIKRLGAFVLDLMVIFVLSSIIGMFIPSSNTKDIEERLNDITNELAEEQITFDEYINESAELNYELARSGAFVSIIGVLIHIGYFIIYQFRNDGQTLGKKVLRIKIVKEKGELELKDMIIRSSIANGILLSVLLLIFLLVFNVISYYYASMIITFIFGLITIVSGIIVLYSKEKKSIHDYICGTVVVEE